MLLCARAETEPTAADRLAARRPDLVETSPRMVDRRAVRPNGQGQRLRPFVVRHWEREDKPAARWPERNWQARKRASCAWAGSGAGTRAELHLGQAG